MIQLKELIDNSGIKTIFSSKWISIKQTKSGYQFAERKGKNSIAVILYKKDGEDVSVLMRMQPMNVMDESKLYPCPVTGGFNDGETDPIQVVIREVKEETAYVIDKAKLKLLTTYMVGTQTNEICYLYCCDITGVPEPKKEPKGDGTADEEKSENVWKPIDDLKTAQYAGSKISYLYLYDLLFSK